MKLGLTSSLLFLASSAFVTGEDLSKPWTSVKFNVLHADSAAAVTIEGSETLTKVNLSLIGKSMDVPEEELEGIDKPALETAQLLFGEDWYGEWKEGEKPTPHFIIEMNYGEESKFGNVSTVRFLFHSGDYQARITTVQETAKVWQVSRKAPGEEPVQTGTATRPASPGRGDVEGGQ